MLISKFLINVFHFAINMHANCACFFAIFQLIAPARILEPMYKRSTRLTWRMFAFMPAKQKQPKVCMPNWINFEGRSVSSFAISFRLDLPNLTCTHAYLCLNYSIFVL